MFTSIVGNVFGSKCFLAPSRLEDLQIPIAHVKTFGVAPWYQVERDKLNKYGRPYWDVLLNQNWDYPLRTYGRAVYECLRGGLDFTKDDENVNSQPFMGWRDRSYFC
ncbi:hypothetical protein IFM89_004388 [Coptis chinensis]|uniref:Ribulose bisphosphate carboxylase large chain n=1 Tax=Coptis chinensis TaxID=261450 RepID=A0A835M271_9MAGN|nr:hypothetical protein IFM89_004388 [Coptis chinensis]